jgi:proteasome lid subunit RPN8/RPN11
MNIVIQPLIMAKLMAFANATAPREFSGFGFVTRKGDDLEVYDVVILNIGSEVYTEIAPKKLIDLMARPDYANCKLWYHRHPINTWSSRDLATILTEPLGGIPEMVKWSASIVLTPHGWIGRVDNYVKKTTAVCPVLPSLTEVYETVGQIRPEWRNAWDDDFDEKKSGVSSEELETLAARLQSIAEDLGVAQNDLEQMMIDAQEEDDMAGLEEGDIDYVEERSTQFLSRDYQAIQHRLVGQAQSEQDKLVGGAKLLARS